MATLVDKLTLFAVKPSPARCAVAVTCHMVTLTTVDTPTSLSAADTVETLRTLWSIPCDIM